MNVNLYHFIHLPCLFFAFINWLLTLFGQEISFIVMVQGFVTISPRETFGPSTHKFVWVASFLVGSLTAHNIQCEYSNYWQRDKENIFVEFISGASFVLLGTAWVIWNGIAARWWTFARALRGVRFLYKK